MYCLFVLKPVDVCSCALLVNIEEDATISHGVCVRGESWVVSEPSECAETGPGSHVDAWVQRRSVDGTCRLEKGMKRDL